MSDSTSIVSGVSDIIARNAFVIKKDGMYFIRKKGPYDPIFSYSENIEDAEFYFEDEDEIDDLISLRNLGENVELKSISVLLIESV